MVVSKTGSINLKNIPQKNTNLSVRKEKNGLLVYDKNSKRKFFVNNIAEKVFELCDGTKSFSEIIFKFPDVYRRELINFFADLIRANLINTSEKLKESQTFLTYPYTISNITIPLSAPLHIYWEITYKCNLNCKHCYVKDRKLRRSELSLGDCRKIIDQLAQLKVFEITFSGGEPLMNHSLIELIKYATQKGIAALITTNGTLINQDFAIRLKKAGLQAAQVSLDSSEEKVHDEFRGVSGAFRVTLKGIKNLLKADIPVVLATVPTKRNVKQIKNLIKLARRLGIQGYRILECKPFGRGGGILDEMISFGEYRKLLKEIINERKKGEPFIIISESFAFLTDKKFQKISNNPLIDCPAGRSMLSITPDGFVSPCSYFAFAGLIIGDLKKERISKIWRNSPLLKELRAIDFYKKKDGVRLCDSCLYSKQCGRGCRALAYKESGNLRGLDPRCLRVLKMKGRK